MMNPAKARKYGRNVFLQGGLGAMFLNTKTTYDESKAVALGSELWTNQRAKRLVSSFKTYVVVAVE